MQRMIHKILSFSFYLKRIPRPVDFAFIRHTFFPLTFSAEIDKTFYYSEYRDTRFAMFGSYVD